MRKFEAGDIEAGTVLCDDVVVMRISAVGGPSTEDEKVQDRLNLWAA